MCNHTRAHARARCCPTANTALTTSKTSPATKAVQCPVLPLSHLTVRDAYRVGNLTIGATGGETIRGASTLLQTHFSSQLNIEMVPELGQMWAWCTLARAHGKYKCGEKIRPCAHVNMHTSARARARSSGQQEATGKKLSSKHPQIVLVRRSSTSNTHTHARARLRGQAGGRKQRAKSSLPSIRK